MTSTRQKSIEFQDDKEYLMVKYEATYGKWGDTIRKCYVLNKKYTKKFKLNPINELIVNYPTAGGYDSDSTTAKIYFQEKITKNTYDAVKHLSLVDDENEITTLLDNE